MPLSKILLSALLSINPAYQDTLVDLTGNCFKERIIYHRSYSDSSSCQVFSCQDSTYTELFEIKFKLFPGEDYRLFFDDYNQDSILDFTIEKPSTEVTYYFTYDKKKKKFIIKE